MVRNGSGADDEVHRSQEQHFLQRETTSCDLPHDRLTIDPERRISLQGKRGAKLPGTRNVWKIAAV